MEMFADVEARFMQADELMTQGKFVEARDMLIAILEDEPDYGMAHNHLGWLYWTRLSDYERGGKHLRLAVRFSPDYPAGHINYCFLLYETGEYGKLLEVAQSALEVQGIAKFQVFRMMAYAKEMCGELNEALKLLKTARSQAPDGEMMTMFNGDIKRVRRKMGAGRWFSQMLNL